MCSCLSKGDIELSLIGGGMFLGTDGREAGTWAGLKPAGPWTGLKFPKFLARSSAALARLSSDAPKGEDGGPTDGGIFIKPGSMSGFEFIGGIIIPDPIAWEVRKAFCIYHSWEENIDDMAGLAVISKLAPVFVICFRISI